MNIVLTGGSGVLGSEILKLNNEIIAPSRVEMNIVDSISVFDFLRRSKPDLLIHCAAITDTIYCENNISKCIEVNVKGTINVCKFQDYFKYSVVYISTDYVFDGQKGNYSVDDPINPLSVYSKSKASGELVARMNSKNLIIRTSFIPLDFRHDGAFVDQYTTKDFVDIISKKVYSASISSVSGVINIGTDRDSVYNKVIKRYPKVKPISIDDIKNIAMPRDVSLKLQGG